MRRITAPGQRPSRRNPVPMMLSAATVVGCAAYIAINFYANPDFLRVLGNVRAIDILFLALAHALFLLAQGLRYFVAFREFGGSGIPLAPWLRTFVIAQAVNFVAPQLGNVYRAVQLKALFGIGLTQYVGGFGFFTWIALVTSFLFGGLLILLVEPRFSLFGVPVAWALLCLTFIATAVPILAFSVSQLASLRVSRLEWLCTRIDNWRTAAVKTLRSPSFWLFYPALTLVSSAISLTVIWLCLGALGREVEIPGLIFLYLSATVLSHIQLSPGNLGIQEMVYGGGAAIIGLTLSDGVLVSLLIRTTGVMTLFALSIPMGIRDALGSLRAGRPIQ